MKHVLKIAAAGALVAGFAAPAAAQIVNPWTGDGAEVGVNIEVGALGEVWSAMGTDQARNGTPAPTLAITNAGGTIPPEGIAEDTVSHFANVNYEVSVDISGTIPDFTRFHILWGVSNRGAYDAIGPWVLTGQTPVVADQIVTYRRDAGGYAPGGDGATPGVPVVVETGTPSTSANSTFVDYAADAIHGLPPVSPSTPVQVIYTIAEQ